MNLEKSKTSPYYKIAKQALMNWNGLTEENDLSDFVYNGGDNNVIKHWKDENKKNGVHSENKEMYNNCKIRD